MIGRLALSMVPLWGWVAAAGVVVAGGAAWHYAELREARDEGRAEVQVRWDRERAANTSAALLATAEARAEEQRRLANQQESNREAERLIARLRAGELVAAAAGDGLRQRAAAVAARCNPAPSNPAVVAASPPASAPGDLLADVSGRLEAAGRLIAAVAHERYIRGLACERQHDALGR